MCEAEVSLEGSLLMGVRVGSGGFLGEIKERLTRRYRCF